MALNQNAKSAAHDKYPALAEMGIQRFSEISHYSLRTEHGNRDDVLRVYYQRAKGSLLPTSRKYRFGRAVKSVVVDGGTSTMQDQYEISPFLLKAVAELDSIVKDRKSAAGSREQLLADLENFETVVSSELNNLRRQIEALKS